jgi:hypothetical protein
MVNTGRLPLRFMMFGIAFSLFSYRVVAQQKINAQEITKIILQDNEGDMDSDLGISIEVRYEHGRWNSYQTKVDVEEDLKHNENKSSDTRIGITTLDKLVVNDFLNSIAVIKPQLDWHIFGITTESLKVGLKPSKLTGKNVPQLSDYINDKTIEAGIIASKYDGGMDIGVYCSIQIIKNNNDTIRMESRNQTVCMLPWTMNKHETFDLSINRFFVAAMGNKSYPNKERLQTITMKGAIEEHIYRDYMEIPMRNYRWNYGYPENSSLIESNFSISNLQLQGVDAHCVLHSNEMPANVFIGATINLANTASVQKLIRFKDTINTGLKSNNFVFKYYRDQPGTKIIFPWDPHYRATGYVILSELQKQIPSLTKIEIEKMVYFHIELSSGGSYWLLLPTGKLILLFNSGDSPAGLANALVNKVTASLDFNSYAHYILFNADGTLAKQ